MDQKKAIRTGIILIIAGFVCSNVAYIKESLWFLGAGIAVELAGAALIVQQRILDKRLHKLMHTTLMAVALMTLLLIYYVLKISK